jgi:hypothetical protein
MHFRPFWEDLPQYGKHDLLLEIRTNLMPLGSNPEKINAPR